MKSEEQSLENRLKIAIFNEFLFRFTQDFMVFTYLIQSLVVIFHNFFCVNGALSEGHTKRFACPLTRTKYDKIGLFYCRLVIIVTNLSSMLFDFGKYKGISCGHM